MNRKQRGIIGAGLLAAAALLLNLTGCAARVRAEDLMVGITPQTVKADALTEPQSAALTDFAVRLLRESATADGKNTLVSPLSVLYALGMTANGAEGETRQQMEAALGLPVGELNSCLYSYRQALSDGDSALRLANSVWFTADARFTANREFLQKNADYYGADVFSAPFDDRTCREINRWVKTNTDGMIPEILDQIPEDAVMYLVNALAFEAEWAKPYTADQVSPGQFTAADGTKREAEFLSGTESTYLEDDKATGFLKYYADGRTAFAALLPKEGVSVSDYIASLDGAALSALLKAPQTAEVMTAIPKFSTEFSLELSGVCKTMGMTRAFDGGSAEFAGLGTSAEGNIFIGRVLHRTFLSVGEQGTKAGAATVVEMKDECAAVDAPEAKRVILDRPFVYMLIDCASGVPFFIGALTESAA